MIQDLPKVSVILPVYNEAGFIEDCLGSLLSNTYPPQRMEILVIDGGSVDGTQDIVRRIAGRDTRVKLLHNPRKIIAAGINIGIEQAKGDVLIRMDGHAAAAESFIEQSVQVLAEHPEAWVVGGAIETINKNFIGRVIAAAMSSPAGVGNAMFRLGDHEGYVDTVLYGAYRRSALEAVGKLDEQLLRTEDDDLHFRIHEAGGKFFLTPRIRSSYYARSSLRKLWRQYFQYGFWRIPTMMKHHRPATIRQTVPLLFVLGWIALILGSLWLGAARWLLAGYAACYLLALMAGAAHVSLKRGPALGVCTLFIFPILHFAYGLGGLSAIWKLVILRRSYQQAIRDHT